MKQSTRKGMNKKPVIIRVYEISMTTKKKIHSFQFWIEHNKPIHIGFTNGQLFINGEKLFQTEVVV